MKEVYPSFYQGCLFSRVEHVLLGCNHLYRPAKNINIRLKIVLLGQMRQLKVVYKRPATNLPSQTIWMDKHRHMQQIVYWSYITSIVVTRTLIHIEHHSIRISSV